MPGGEEEGEVGEGRCRVATLPRTFPFLYHHPTWNPDG